MKTILLISASLVALLTTGLSIKETTKPKEISLFGFTIGGSCGGINISKIFTRSVVSDLMGFKIVGFDNVWKPMRNIYWGKATTKLGDERCSGNSKFEGALATDKMGLIYVNPERPSGYRAPLLSVKIIN